MPSAASVAGSGRVHSKVVCIRTASLPPVLPTSKFPPCPAYEHQLMLFATFLSEQGLSWQSIKCYLAAVRNLHLVTGFPFPRHQSSLPRLQLLLQGIKRVSSRRSPQQSRLPITPSILSRIRSFLFAQSCTWDRRMIWAAMNMCFFSFLRSGEICTPSSTNFDPGAHLTIADISVDDRASPSKLFVRIKASKTDPFRAGVTVVLGATLQELCPITAILPFLTLRGGRRRAHSLNLRTDPT